MPLADFLDEALLDDLHEKNELQHHQVVSALLKGPRNVRNRHATPPCAQRTNLNYPFVDTGDAVGRLLSVRRAVWNDAVPWA